MGTLAIIGMLITSATLLIGYNLHIHARERREMIEKGLDPSLINIYSKKRNYGDVFLFTGIFLLGMVGGISNGIILAKLMNLPGETKELIILCLILWTGISSFLCYYLVRRKEKA